MDLKHEETTNRNRFYLEDEGKEVGEMTYIYVKDHIIDINHTFINEDLRGKDLGLKLIGAAVKYMRKNGLKAIPSCPYVKKVFDESSEYSDIVA